jgi:hypothetical protein
VQPEKHTKAPFDASKEVGLEVNPKKTKYMLMSRCPKVGQRYSIKTANRSFGDVKKLKYLGATLTDQNCIPEEITSRLIRGMLATIRFSLLSSRLLHSNVKVKLYKTIILSVLLYGRETWSLTVRKSID